MQEEMQQRRPEMAAEPQRAQTAKQETCLYLMERAYVVVRCRGGDTC